MNTTTRYAPTLHSLSLYFGLSFALLFSACEGEGPTAVNYDRKGLLEHYAQNLILPEYQEFGTACSDLENAWDSFADVPSTEGLDLLRQRLVQAWTDWQTVAPLDFGPALDRGLLGFVNTFPADSAGIDFLMEAGTWNLDQADNLDVQGFSALDFLLFSRSPEATVAAYSGAGSAAAQRRAYTETLVQRLVQLANAVQTDWENGYAASFPEADGVDVGSSLGKLVNALNRYYERDLRDGKVGIPLGVRSLGIAQPERVEALFSGESRSLAVAGLVAYEYWLLGGADASAPEAPGLDDYLDAVNAQHNGQPLSDEIRAALADAQTSLRDGVTLPLNDAVVAEAGAVQNAYTGLQRLLVLIKVDLPSSLGILITYQDNDGD
ncbi:MAG: hypothetical protein GC205_09585 [Bacteroidetes bacterium]|nr:hypothetical protein [Bacteroidota bacterium]